jgi:hypothetical protein
MSAATTRKLHRIFRALLALLATVTALTAITAAPAVTAQAAPVPVIYNYSSGWHSAAVRPQWVIIGQGGSPMAHTWWWNTWNSTTAKSTGTLWVNNCVPNCAYGKTSYHKLYVTLYWVKWHNGQRYFYAMKWYTPGWTRLGLLFGRGWASTVWLHFSTYPGGSAPFWH